MGFDFRSLLSSELEKAGKLSTKDIYALFPGLNTKTISWHLYDEIQKGSLERTSHGEYRLAKDFDCSVSRNEYISENALEASSYLKALGYDFYVSGLDCMNGLGMTVSGEFPVLICSSEFKAKDIQLELMREFDLAVTQDELISSEIGDIRSKIQFIILYDNSLVLHTDGLAFKEKAFVDLYYACTRLDYPLPKKELPHILSIIKPNRFRFMQATKQMKLSDELNFLLNYDKEFIKCLSDYLG